MIYSGNAAKLLGADTVDFSTGIAELPDDGFMDQFDTVNPQHLHYQTDIDNWAFANYEPDPFSLPYEAIPQEGSTPYPQDPDSGLSPNSNFQHNTNLKKVPGALYQLKATEDPIYGMDIHTDNRPTPTLEQVPYALNQFQGPQESRNGVDLNEDSPSESLDQQWESLQGSLEYTQDFEYLFGFVTDSHFTESDQSLDITNQLQNTLNESTTRFSPKVGPMDAFTTLGPADNGLLHQFQEPLGELATLGPALNGPVYQSPDPQGEFTNPVSTRNGPSLFIEQPPVVRENYPQAPGLSIHTHPDDQHLSDDIKMPLAPRTEIKQSKIPLNKRKGNIESIDTNKYYQRLSEAPRGWEPRNGNGMLTFQYNEYGELSTNKFSPDQINRYLYDHPLNYDRNDVYDNKKSRLTLWMQVTPVDSGKRYPSTNSSKCRFADCPIRENSIRKGFFRVAFDEHTASGRQIDPYYCAGFVHLFCLEKFCNFPNICHNLVVLPDQRSLPEGRNKMALTRDHEEMVEVVRTFIESSQNNVPWDYEQTLCFRLTSKHLELEPTIRGTIRERRGGNHIGLHKGDLDKFVAGEIHKFEQRRAVPLALKPRKRKRDIAEEEDVANLEDEVKHQQCQIKRRWRFR